MTETGRAFEDWTLDSWEQQAGEQRAARQRSQAFFDHLQPRPILPLPPDSRAIFDDQLDLLRATSDAIQAEKDELTNNELPIRTGEIS